jgi:hypothetical protein
MTLHGLTLEQQRARAIAGAVIQPGPDATEPTDAAPGPAYLCETCAHADLDTSGCVLFGQRHEQGSCSCWEHR